MSEQGQCVDCEHLIDARGVRCAKLENYIHDENEAATFNPPHGFGCSLFEKKQTPAELAAKNIVDYAEGTWVSCEDEGNQRFRAKIIEIINRHFPEGKP